MHILGHHAKFLIFKSGCVLNVTDGRTDGWTDRFYAKRFRPLPKEESDNYDEKTFLIGDIALSGNKINTDRHRHMIARMG